MYCDRCGEEDLVRLGLDEAHRHVQWQSLCDRCVAELDEAEAADALTAAEHLQRLAGPHGPVTRSRTRYGKGDAYAE